MTRANNQKPRLLYLAKILTDETDEEHGLSCAQLIQKLAEYNVEADRKTIYRDIDVLKSFGIDIKGQKDGRQYYYKVVSRSFELAELKLLVDSVQSARFITEKKSKELIKKLESLVSVNDAAQLQRQVYISGRVKMMNESIYYNVDKLHLAINTNAQISFQYFQWNIEKEQQLRHGGALYRVSPWYLLWVGDNYYLVAYDAESGILKHYRVDKMLKISVLDKAREGEELALKTDAAQYSKMLFGMFGGEKVSVTIEAENSLVGVLIDRFGLDIPITPLDDKRFAATVEVVPSKLFTGWILSLGSGIKITAPQNLVDSIRSELQELSKAYSSDYSA